jgi:hypothetical protein
MNLPLGHKYGRGDRNPCIAAVAAASELVAVLSLQPPLTPHCQRP